MTDETKPVTTDDRIAVLDSGVTKDQEKDCFEIGLVLGGTVSAGAYTAGFLDFLIEALDAWYVAKEEGDDVPRHKVRLRVAAGASGGAVCAAILARVLAYSFKHVSAATNVNDDEDTGNPFYDTWVRGLDISGFLDMRDLNGNKPLQALLNGAPIAAAGNKVAGFVGRDLPRDWPSRPYVDDPFRVILTLGNLTGIPYEVEFDGGVTQSYKAHADHVRFACRVGLHRLPDPFIRPDEFYVEDGGLGDAVNWMTVAKYARASGAFPIGFPPVDLQRPRKHYDYRVALIPTDAKKLSPVSLIPSWPDDAPLDYAFTSVDGGAFNNEPIELARTYLSGVMGRNPRYGDKANKAIVLIDPLPGMTEGPENGAQRTLLSLGGGLLSAFVGHGRYSTADLMLMADPNVFSRFIALPERGPIDPPIRGETALATAGLGAFIGFFEQEYRRHDYLLGRANCQTFLSRDFALDQNNDLFEGTWSADHKKVYRRNVGDSFLPVIPLVGRMSVKEGTVPWPLGKLTARSLAGMLQERAAAIFERVADDAIDFPLSDLPIALLKGLAAKKIVGIVEEKADKDLKKWGL